MAADGERTWGDSGNPYLSTLLDSALVDLSTPSANDGGVALTLGGHAFRLRPDPRSGQAVIDGYDNLGPSRTARSLLRLSCGLSFQIGDVPSTSCRAGSIHVLDDALMFVGSDGSVGPTALSATESFVLVSPPDLVVAVERQVITNASQRRELVGFRVVLVNPIHDDPLLISTNGLDQRALAMLVAAGETFMREQVGSKAGWRPLGDGWETMEWNGVAPTPAQAVSAPAALAQPSSAPSSPSPVPATSASSASTERAQLIPTELTPAQPVPVMPPGRPTAGVNSAGAATHADGAPQPRQILVDEPSVPPDEHRSRRAFYLVGALVIALLLIAGVALALINRGDGTTETAASTTTPASSDTSLAPSTTVAETTTTEPPPSTTAAEEVTTTTTSAPTTTASTGPAPTSESQQLAVWGFTEPAELATPSGEAVCPTGEPSATGTVVGVNVALNVRDGADSSYQILQRLDLGFDQVAVYPSATSVSRRGTEWVTVALIDPPGTSPTTRRCGWVATQFLSYDD